MPMKPHKGESQSDFMARCMEETFGADAPEDRTQEQAVAICMQYWRDAKGGKKPESAAAEVQRILARFRELNIARKLEDLPEPDEGESRADFMERCLDEISDFGLDDDDAEDTCRVAWEELGPGDDDEEESMRGIVHKTHATEGGGMEFIMSDATPDRYGDVIAVEGWDFKNFQRNPVALFNHNPNHPIGTWDNIRIHDGALRGNLRMAPEGTSERIDEIRKLIQAGILRAVSVGFRPIRKETLDARSDDFFGPFRYLQTELVETSLVAIPANPNALAVAKSLQISPEVVHLVFGKHAKKGNETHGRDRRRLRASTPNRSMNDKTNGKHATSQSSNRKGTAMSGLSQRITETQARIRENCDRLQAHYEHLNDDNVSDTDMETTNKLNADIARDRKVLAMLEESEKQLGGTVTNGGSNGGKGNAMTVLHDQRRENGNGIDDAERERRRQYFQATSGSKELKPLDYAVRAGVATYLARVFGRTPDDICKGYEPYNNDKTRAVVDWSIRTAVNPAMTTVTGWAAELVTQINADYLGLLQPQSVFPRLAAKGLQLSFGRAGRINIPMRSATPTIAGSFVGEGLPIPVRRGAFTSQVLTPKKLAVITTWTKELDAHSIPAIEGLLRDAIGEDTAVALDSVLLDSNPATVIRPAGLLNGISSQTPTALGGNAFNAIVGDIKNLMGALVTATKGNIRTPTFLMNPAEILSASLIVPPNTGVMPFRDELARGTLLNIPVIDSGTVPAKTVILVDAADFVTVGAEGPTFDVSDSATIHEEDTAPAAIVGGTAPGTPATPVRSLWQTDTLALRMIQRLNYTMRRTGMVAYVANVTW